MGVIESRWEQVQADGSRCERVGEDGGRWEHM